ncbi:MAG: hypothetical protein LBO74_14130 [Candidatus Symbiothrix sp.]|jgi:hypothetical protein|nr:hypothetical protein [Candidatus Symbiothrix sp.]
MNITELHNCAMDLADRADIQKAKGLREKAILLYEQSYNFEYKAAMLAYQNKIGEPSVSILLRSAASLAISCLKYKEADKLIKLAFSGEPPVEIAEELKSLLNNVILYRPSIGYSYVAYP